MQQQEIVRARDLARAVKDEAMTGGTSTNFLVWQLAMAVEELAEALTKSTSALEHARVEASLTETWPIPPKKKEERHD